MSGRTREERCALAEEAARKARARTELVATAIPLLADGLRLVIVAQRLRVSASRLSRLLQRAGIAVVQRPSRLPHGLPVD
jgi:hypothetical protein